jgi:hypothetical protein
VRVRYVIFYTFLNKYLTIGIPPLPRSGGYPKCGRHNGGNAVLAVPDPGVLSFNQGEAFACSSCLITLLPLQLI